MPLFLIERSFAEDVVVTSDGANEIRLINDEVGVSWVYSFLSADLRKSYCLYEAPNAEALREAARRAQIPADAIIELTGQIFPDGSMRPISAGT